MRHRSPFGARPAWLAAIALLALVAGGASAQTAAAPTPQPVEPPRILPAEVKALAEKGKVLIVDVRGKDSYDLEHAEGAISIPLDQLPARLAELPRNKMIAAYCT